MTVVFLSALVLDFQNRLIFTTIVYGLCMTESTKRCNFDLLHAVMPVPVAARSKA